MKSINKNDLKDNKRYLKVSLIEHSEILNGVLSIEGDQLYEISEDVIDNICKQSGISNSINKILRMKGSDTWKNTVVSLYQHYYPEGTLTFLLDDNIIDHVSFKSYQPMLNKEFLEKTSKFFADYEDVVDIEQYDYDEHNTVSDVLIFHKERYEYNNESYRFGILISNDELTSVSCTYAVEYKGIIFYLPSKFCGLSSARYLRTSSNSIEAYELLLLRIVSEMSSDKWFYLIPEISSNISNCKGILLTYEEYRKALRLLTRTAILSDMTEGDIKSITEEFEEAYQDFDHNYPSLEDKKNCYIWRCSAVGEATIYTLIESIQRVASDFQYYPESQKDIRQTIGDFIMLNKISTELAKKKER